MMSKSELDALIKKYCYQGNGNGTILTMAKSSSVASIEFAKIAFKDSEIKYK